jgi:hypothetical protein
LDALLDDANATWRRLSWRLGLEDRDEEAPEWL